MTGLQDAVVERIRTELEIYRDADVVPVVRQHAIEVEQTIEGLYWAARGRRNDMQFFADKQAAEMNAKNYAMGRRSSE